MTSTHVAPKRLKPDRTQANGTAPTRPTRHRFTWNDLLRMVRAGILPEDARIELIDGEVMEMAAVHDRHAGQVIVITDIFRGPPADSFFLSVQGPLRLSPTWVPQPDLVLLRRGADGYQGGVPEARDAVLVIEVSDSTHRHDRIVKGPRYALAGIPEFWLVDVRRRVLEVYCDPLDRRYQSVIILTCGETIAPLALPELVLSIETVTG